MYTRNFYAYWLRWHANLTSDADQNTLLDGTFPYVLTNGGKWPTTSTNYKPSYSYNLPNYWKKCIENPKFVAAHSIAASSSGTSQYNYGVFFGTGNSPANIDDYTFAGDFVTGCVASVVVTREIGDDQTSAIVTAVYTITNNNDTTVTIGEMGMFHEVHGRTSSSQYANLGIMIERTALDTPITIEPGGVGQVTYTLNFNFPTT